MDHRSNPAVVLSCCRAGMGLGTGGLQDIQIDPSIYPQSEPNLHTREI